jgi:Ni,Fe-hydrogenase III component G
METAILLQTAETLLKPWILASNNPDDSRLDVRVSPENLIPAIQSLLQGHWGYLSAITGLDHTGAATPPSEEKQWAHLSENAEQSLLHPEGTIEILYHFCQGAAIVTLRVSIPYDRPVISSICELVPPASLYERELMEMFGVVVEGTPSTEHLLLPDDWPANVYPLRKSFTGFSKSNEEDKGK